MAGRRQPLGIPAPHMTQSIGFGGYTGEPGGRTRHASHGMDPERNVTQCPNYLVPGFRNGVVNTLRLWSAESPDEFNLEIFNAGDYENAVAQQVRASNLSKVLYPEDSTRRGKQLRLSQQYFFVAASIRDFLDQTVPAGFPIERLPERVIFQLNDTHPVIGIPELLRILIDQEG